MARLLDRPRLLGLISAWLCGALGLAYLAGAGAPVRYLSINLAALVVGGIAWVGLSRATSTRRTGVAVLALSLAILATAIFGVSVEGATRWVAVGPLRLQTSLIALPALIVLYARCPDAVGTAGVLTAAAALGLQPDRAMAAVLAAGIAAHLLAGRSRLSAVALAGAAAGLVSASLRPDEVPPVPFVEGVFGAAFQLNWPVGIAIIVGAIVLLAPALSAMRPRSERAVLSAFGASWAMVIAAAALGDYPTPFVGYGASAILGYLLSAGLLKDRQR